MDILNGWNYAFYSDWFKDRIYSEWQWEGHARQGQLTFTVWRVPALQHNVGWKELDYGLSCHIVLPVTTVRCRELCHSCSRTLNFSKTNCISPSAPAWKGCHWDLLIVLSHADSVNSSDKSLMVYSCLLFLFSFSSFQVSWGDNKRWRKSLKTTDWPDASLLPYLTLCCTPKPGGQQWKLSRNFTWNKNTTLP